MNIYLISTVHREKGKCTSESLFEILDKIKPDVVFCETSKELFDSFRQGNINTSLEFNAIDKLSKYHSFSFVAVDSFPQPDRIFRKQIEQLFDIIGLDKYYSQAWSKNNKKTNLYGFEYLNSIENTQIFDEMSKREKKVISQLDNLEFKIAYQKWLQIIDNRENEMLENINSYVEHNEFEKAVFLCGAAHRKSIIEKIYKSKTKEQLKVSWTIFGN
jgi:pheromone shutdown protein TraB